MEKCKEAVSGMMANQLRNHNVNANKVMPLNRSEYFDAASSQTHQSLFNSGLGLQLRRSYCLQGL